jgi:D-inositol-3-phosphate glycosyltransferase
MEVHHVGGRRGHDVKRVAMLSVHTSPLAQPGFGDAGGMNVYVLELARQLARFGVESEIFTRATASDQPPAVRVEPGVTVRHVVAGPFEGLTKADLPSQLCTFARDVLRIEAAHAPYRYDVIHSHYWLSGQVGAVARERWSVPLIHTMHTMAKVKNAAAVDGETAEPLTRIVGEEQVVDAADRLVASTAEEADALIRHYDADPRRVDVVHPGVDLAAFTPTGRDRARRELGLRPDAPVLLFAGRLQPLKAPDVVLRAARALLDRSPTLRGRLLVVVAGGQSGAGPDQSVALRELAGELGIGDVVRYEPALPRERLAQWYAAASLVCVPSYSESFGLVALEAQACGTPVVASDVGGLPTAIRDGRSGRLVHGHDPVDWARTIDELLSAPTRLALMGRHAVRHAAAFGWDRTAHETMRVYRAAMADLPRPRVAVS